MRSYEEKKIETFPDKKGDVLTVEFKVAGVSCIGLNGGPTFKHNEAFSFQIATDDQSETDRYWTPSSATAASRARVAGAKTSGACRGKSRRVC
jgi:predicted 3-demethylubiquinone-9 3-methyltransferase (glyoxalase superfamily)